MSRQCSTCGTSNDNSARFCSHCGAEYQVEVEITCPKCKTVNISDARFCETCGVAFSQIKEENQTLKKKDISQRDKLRQKEREKKKTPKTTTNNIWLFLVPTLVVVFVWIFFNRVQTKQTVQNNTAPILEQKSNDPALEAKVLQVASKFICSCGTCGEQPLDTCACETAGQERQFIRTQIQSGQSLEQVILVLNSTYGWMKKEFVVQYDSLARKNGISTKVTLPPDIQSGLLSSNSAVKKTGINNVKINREEVFSHFRCPCGKCGMDDLNICECAHPRGAKEVKAFVDEKIALNQYSMDQIIQLVDEKYGGKKL